jgi:hypothetical protein
MNKWFGTIDVAVLAAVDPVDEGLTAAVSFDGVVNSLGTGAARAALRSLTW